MIFKLLRTNWQLKVWVTLVLNAFFWGGYATLGRYAFFPIRNVPITAVDQAVSFEPWPWAWVYLSIYLITAPLPWMLTERADIRRYSWGIVAMSLISFAIYFLFPTASPRPLEIGASVPMRAIAACDGPLNAFPSLHAAFIAYMGLLAWRMFGRSAPWWTVVTTLVWGGAIIYSTLPTKQHYVLDLVAGAAIGAFADWLVWRKSPVATASLTIPLNKGYASQEGVR